MSFRPVIAVGWLLLLLGPAVVGALLLARRTEHPRRWLVRAGAVGTLLVMGLGPAVPHSVEEEGAVAVEMFFVVDRTGSMAAEDWAAGVPRLDGVRADVPALVDAVPGARYSVIGWSSEATRQLPMTTDARAVRAWTQTVRQEITAYSTGSLLDRPLEALRTALESAAEQNPSHVRLVFFLSDGEQTAPGQPASYEGVAHLVDGGAVLGYGTSDGGPMRSYDGSLDRDPDAPYITDPSAGDGTGQAPVAISRIDQSALQRVADQLGVPYAHRTADDDVTDVVDGLDPQEIAAETRSTRTSWRLVLWPFAVALAGFLAAEAWWTTDSWLPVRRPREATP